MIPSSIQLKEVLTQLQKLHSDLIKDVDCSMNFSQQNLDHYLALRRVDLDELQEKLIAFGLNSLGHSQSFILNAIENEINTIEHLLNQEITQFSNPTIDYEQAKSLHKQNSQMFGQRLEKDFKTRVMVTMPTWAAYDDSFLKSLIENKTSIVCINTAHDSPALWKAMAKQVKQYNKNNAAEIKIYVDLAGPKNRTGSLKKSVKPYKIPAFSKVKLTYNEDANTSLGYGNFAAVFKVDKAFYYSASIAGYVEIKPSNKRKKILCKLYKNDDELYFETKEKFNATEKTRLMVFENKEQVYSNLFDLAPSADEVRVFENNLVLLAKEQIVGQSKYEYENTIYDAAISCTNDEIFDYIKIGDRIFIDDGKIGCEVVNTNDLGVVCKVTLAKPTGTKLKEEKGINFVDTQLQIDAITKEDLKSIDACIGFADMFGISFAQSAKDILRLQNILFEKGKEDTAIVAKIETKLAVKNIFEIVKALLWCKNKGVMIARGDLAIEVGFENMAYIQEEIFDICEAAHIPVIYATQILEGKMKKNLPSRAEITDAANAQRADCVMLNKGPYVIQTLKSIKNILRQMHTIYQKNRVILKHLEI